MELDFWEMYHYMQAFAMMQIGKPTVVAEPESVRAMVFMGIAQEVGEKCGLL